MSSEIAEKLSRQTRTIVSEFEGRVDSFRGRGDLLRLTVGLDAEDAEDCAREYFGEGEHIALGIDGSMDFDERLQMMVFYSNATAYACPFSVDEGIRFDLARVGRRGKLSASAAVPLWMEDITEVVPRQLEIDLELEHWVERIPNAFMTLAELYLASKAVDDARVIFMDRPLSGTYATLARDVRVLLQGRMRNLEKLRYGGTKVSFLDIKLALQIGSPSKRLPATARYLPYRIIRELMDGARSNAALAANLHVEERDVSKAVRRLAKLDQKYDGALIAGADGATVAIREEVRGYWERSARLAREYANAVYERGEHPLAISSDEWLTVFDISAISFLLLESIGESAISKKVMVVGIAKDTTASDISRSVLPFGIRENVIRLESLKPRLSNDRAFLTLLSAVNKTLVTPWRTRGYDAAFSTIVSLGGGGSDMFVPARKAVSRENLFVRGFFQLRTLGKEGRVRSPVFLFDRFFSPGDDSGTMDLKVTWRDQVTIVEPYFEEGHSRETNLVLLLLSLCDNPEVFEALGHNQLLYLADKAVKAEIRLMKSSLRGVSNLSLGMISRREQVSGISTPFREQRQEMEQERTRTAGRG